MRLWQDQSFRGYREMEVSPPNYRDWKRMSRSFESIGATMGTSANVVGRGEPRRLDGETITAEVLPLLGAAPALGRIFVAEDDRAGAAGVLLISDALWKSEFGGDPAALGRTLLLDDEPFTVVGVMPPGFAYPNRAVEFWTPMRLSEEDRGPDESLPARRRHASSGASRSRRRARRCAGSPPGSSARIRRRTSARERTSFL